MTMRLWMLFQDDFLREMGRSMGGSRQDANIFLVILAVLFVAGLAAAVYYLLIWPRLRRRREIEEMFGALCSANNLSREEAALLRTIVRREKIATPATIFVRPSAFGRSDDVKIAALKNKLFSV